MRGLAWLGVAASIVSPACNRHRDATAAAESSSGNAAVAPSTVSSASGVRSAAAPSGGEPSPGAAASAADLGARLIAPAKACRALEVKGQVTDESGHVIATSTPLDRAEWLDLAPGARLTVVNTLTSRELTFVGKARVLPCVAGEERFYVVQGEVRTAAAAGARPGAEVLVATPFGVVRYGDARLDVTVDAHGYRVRADVGDAWIVSPSPEPSGVTEEKLPAGKHVERKGLTVDVKALLHGCEVSAEVAEARARTVLRPGPSDQATPLGTRAAEHVRARRASRFACAIAGAALGTLEIGGDRDALVWELGRAEARFLGVPSAEKTESR